MLAPGPRADAEDVLQDVFVRAYFSLRADDRPMAARAWLYRVAHNRCIDAMRRPAPIPAEQQDAPPATCTTRSARLTRREDLRRLVTDLGRLPEQQRSALLMRELEGLSYAELAAALGCTLPAVKSLLVRARIGLAEAARRARRSMLGDPLGPRRARYDRRVRASAPARRHMRDCADCRSFREAMQGSSREMDALAPVVTARSSGSTKLLGLGGSGAAAQAALRAARRRRARRRRRRRRDRRRRRHRRRDRRRGRRRRGRRDGDEGRGRRVLRGGRRGRREEDRAPSDAGRQARRIGRRARPGTARRRARRATSRA